MKISACLITKNEEKNIARCIKSFKEAVDEIILVDTGSTDNTVKIARRFGAKVFYFKWNNNFSDARNYALKQAKGNWIIFLDADEYFCDNSIKNLKNLMRSVHEEKKVDSLYIKIVHLNQDGKRKNSVFLHRIFKNDKKIKYFGSIHETIKREDGKLNSIYIPEDQLKIYHTGYSSESILEDKAQRNLKALIKELENGNDSPQILWYLSECYYLLKDFNKTIKYAKQYFKCNVMLDYNVLLYINMIESMMKLDYDIEEILIEVNNALKDFPSHPDIHNLKARVMFINKRYNEALQSYDSTIYHGFNGSKHYDCSGWPSYLDRVYYHLAVIYEFKNDYTRTEEYLTKSLRENKNNEEPLAKLLNIVKKRNAEEIISLLNSLYNINNIEDIMFLVTCLAKLRYKPVFMQYYNILYNKLGKHHITYLFLHLSTQKYKEAYEYFLDCYLEENSDWAILFAVVSAILVNDTEKLKSIKKYTKPSLRKVIESYSDCSVSLNNENVNDFIGLLNEFIYLGTMPQVNCMLNLKNQFSQDISLEIGSLLLKTNVYGKAIEQFSDALILESSNYADIYYKIGYCYYKLFDYRQALDFMNKALEHGYKENDIFEFICWIKEFNVTNKSRFM